jgi:hypothetical protein
MNTYRLLCFLAASICSAACAAATSPVLLISVDGLHPAYVTEADRHGLKIPALRRLLQQGAHARGVVGVVPTVTYPSHTTLLTGVTPQEHGIISNTPFDPLNVNKEGWYWYAEDIKAKTLWEVAASAGLRTASVNWPVTVGERHISFLLPEYWRASTADDLKLMRQLDRPQDLMEQLEAKLGPSSTAMSARSSRIGFARGSRPRSCASASRSSWRFTSLHSTRSSMSAGRSWRRRSQRWSSSTR